ncbi:MAG: transposase, partial [Clostridia bacterium]
DGIQNPFKETIAEFMENGPDAELDDELGFSKFTDDLKAVYAAVDEASVVDALDAFAQRRDKKRPGISRFWRENLANLSACFKFPQAVQRLIYTTNAIEGFNRQLRKVSKAKSVFPTDDSLFKMLYLAMRDILKK